MPIEIWTASIVRPSLVAFTRAEICLVASARVDQIGEIREKLEGAQHPSKVLGRRDTVIPLSAITSVCLDQARGEMLVHYSVRNKEGKQESDSGFIKFREPKAADDFLRALHARLGSGWLTRTKQYNRLRASLKPLTGMVVGLVGSVMGFTTREPFLFILLVLVLIACFVWLIQYLLKPPRMAFLEPKGSG